MLAKLFDTVVDCTICKNNFISLLLNKFLILAVIVVVFRS